MRAGKLALLLCVGVALLFLCVLASLAFGSRYVPFEVVLNTLASGSRSSLEELVIHERIPRTVFGLMAGAALGISGALMQAITRNPIADPSVLGVNTGASLFVVCGIAFFNIGTPSAYIFFALLGAGLTSILVYTLGSLGQGGTTPIKLALAGAAVSAALSSLVSAVILPRTEVMNAFRFWQVGSISGANWEQIRIFLPLIILGIFSALLLSPGLDALALGDELATGLGARTGLLRLLGAVTGVLLCGATTALAGPIGFVGLMVPHMVRLLIGPSLRKVLPFSVLAGSILLLASDVIGRLLGSPSELEAGVVTAFIGAPILIFIAMKAKVKA